MPKSRLAALGQTLDARPDRLDLRDRPYLPRVHSLPRRWPDDARIRKLLPEYVKRGLVLDQKDEGACTGFGLACVVNYLHFREQVEGRTDVASGRVSMRMLYHLARFYDEWPGERYEGSSCRGALKAWHKHGVCTDALWPYFDARGRNRFVSPRAGWAEDAVTRPLGVYYRVNKASVVDMQAALCEVGALYVSADVHDGWDCVATRRIAATAMTHDKLPVIAAPKTDEVGGHSFALVGYNEHGFVVQNSWGTRWGAGGFAVLPYDDWIERGTDAWVCSLGVPAATVPSRAYVASARPARTPSGGPSGLFGLGRTREPEPSRADPAVAPWPVDEAYFHTVVLGNDGDVINRVVEYENAAAAVTGIVFDRPRAWFRKAGGPRRLVVYAHGGLNSEDDSIRRIRVMAPYFRANGVYPLFLTWRTGALETLVDILEDEVRKALSISGDIRSALKALPDSVEEALDRRVESVCQLPPVRAIWSQMKQNAAASAQGAGGLVRIAAEIVRLSADGPLEVHLAGHSAGSIILGHLLDLLAGKVAAVGTCSLYAPACTVAFANEHYGRAVARGLLDWDRLHLDVLSDGRERDDSIGPYHKSLLYLVSRALEDCHKMPLLGLVNAFDPARATGEFWDAATLPDLTTWQSTWCKGRAPAVLSASHVSCGPRLIPANHSSFDNDVAVVGRTLARMLKLADPAGLAHRVENLDF